MRVSCPLVDPKPSQFVDFILKCVHLWILNCVHLGSLKPVYVDPNIYLFVGLILRQLGDLNCSRSGS